MSQQLVNISDTAVLARAELDTQITTAKAYPRKAKDFIQRATALATMDVETAESCFYCLVREGKDGKRSEIKGPSIRLAEIAASCWGNLHAGTRIIENDGKFITAEGVAWDLEANVKITAQVKRRITTKSGHTYGDDMQQVTGNAACSIALRNAIFKVLPRALVDRVYESAAKFAVGDSKSLSARINKVFDRFSLMGVDQKKILSFFKKKSNNEFNANDLEQLIGIGTAIKDGLQTIDSAFDLNVENIDLSVQDRILNNLNKSKQSQPDEGCDEAKGFFKEEQ